MPLGANESRPSTNPSATFAFVFSHTAWHILLLLHSFTPFVDSLDILFDFGNILVVLFLLGFDVFANMRYNPGISSGYINMIEKLDVSNSFLKYALRWEVIALSSKENMGEPCI